MEKSLKIKLLMGTIFICIFITALAVTLVQKYTPSETMRPLRILRSLRETQIICVKYIHRTWFFA